MESGAEKKQGLASYLTRTPSGILIGMHQVHPYTMLQGTAAAVEAVSLQLGLPFAWLVDEKAGIYRIFYARFQLRQRQVPFMQTAVLCCDKVSVQMAGLQTVKADSTDVQLRTGLCQQCGTLLWSGDEHLHQLSELAPYVKKILRAP